MSDQQPPADETPTRPEGNGEPSPPAPPAPPVVEIPAPPAPPAPQGGYAPPPTWPPPGAPAAPAEGAYPPPPVPQAGYAPGAYPPPAYPYGYPSGPTTSTTGIIGFVLSIVSWVICPVIPAIVALVLASQSQKEILASQGTVGGAGFNTATRIISWINIAFYAAVIVSFGLILGFLAIVDGTGSMS